MSRNAALRSSTGSRDRNHPEERGITHSEDGAGHSLQDNKVPDLGLPTDDEACRERLSDALDEVAPAQHHEPPRRGPPFGHTRPQWIVPYDGFLTVDGVNRRVYADYS
ncbi:MAG: hypothetical protein LH477_00270 [Nocardioides sp.]|nr:hypothetical protein [Nocardioides sp.]